MIVNLNKPLIPCFKLDGRIQKIECENLPSICFARGRYGHTGDYCPRTAKENLVEEQLAVPPMEEVNVIDASSFGNWMHATRKGRKFGRKGNVNYNGSTSDKNGKTGSRFAILANQMENESRRSSETPNESTSIPDIDSQTREMIPRPTQLHGEGRNRSQNSKAIPRTSDKTKSPNRDKDVASIQQSQQSLLLVISSYFKKRWCLMRLLTLKQLWTRPRILQW